MLSSLRRQWKTGGQRGSVLSALLIIVAFLAILGGALLNEISSQFLLTQTLSNRIAIEATVDSSVEYSIRQLQTRSVPSRCSTDSGPGASIALNSDWAYALPTCQAIVPDELKLLRSGSFPIDGAHIVGGGRDTYLVGDGSGNLLNYRFGRSVPMWSVGLGSGLSAPPAQSPDPARPGHFMTVAPIGNRVALVDDSGFGAVERCTMAASATVASHPGFENPPPGTSANFPDYVFFGDLSGSLFVYNAQTDGTCARVASVSGLGGPVVGGPLVLTGQTFQNNDACSGGGTGGGNGDQSSAAVDIFALVNSGGSGRLLHYQYCEGTQGGQVSTNALTLVESTSLGLGTPVGFASDSTVPVAGSTIRLAVSSQSGQVGMASISVFSTRIGLSYSSSAGPVVSLGGSFNDAPYWCHCPTGDQIGVGNRNGNFFVLDNRLNQKLAFNDGGIAINTAPVADANGDWYFGADDGYIHDVEPPATGTAMFQAARFGPGMAVHSSPVAGGPADGCASRVCLYFGATSGADFAQIGTIRVMDLQACPTAGTGATTCSGTPRLWARVEVGDPAYVGGQGVQVISWSFYGS